LNARQGAHRDIIFAPSLDSTHRGKFEYHLLVAPIP
jgi:hypothetical protein